MTVLSLRVRWSFRDDRRPITPMMPIDPPQGHASGSQPYRLLVIGTDWTVGHGVRSHDLGLIGCLARAIATRTGHGADVDLLASCRGTLAEASALLQHRSLDQVDGVVLILEGSEGSTRRAAIASQLRHLLADLVARAPKSTAFAVVVPPPDPRSRTSEGRRQRRLRGFGDLVASTVRPTAAFVQLPALPGAEARRAHEEWATLVAEQLRTRLHEPRRSQAPLDNLEEAARQAAVDRLGLLDKEWEIEFKRIVSYARAAYGTRFAALGVVDRHQTRYVMRQGFDTSVLPRDQTICDTALRAGAGLIVGDAREDERFRSFTPSGDEPVGFYAGYRVEGEAGQPVAVLCVFDPEPRSVAPEDMALLRDLALAVQRRIWELAQSARH